MCPPARVGNGRRSVRRRRRLPPADHRGRADAGRAARHRGRRRRPAGRRCREVPRCSACSCSTRRDGRSPRPPRARSTDAHDAGALVVVATDLLALCCSRPPGELGADIVVGIGAALRRAARLRRPARRLHRVRDGARSARCPAASSASRVDDAGHVALRLALQTREQHIRREKATCNICTAQVLLAVDRRRCTPCTTAPTD